MFDAVEEFSEDDGLDVGDVVDGYEGHSHEKPVKEFGCCGMYWCDIGLTSGRFGL